MRYALHPVTDCAAFLAVGTCTTAFPHRLETSVGHCGQTAIQGGTMVKRLGQPPANQGVLGHQGRFRGSWCPGRAVGLSC